MKYEPSSFRRIVWRETVMRESRSIFCRVALLPRFQVVRSIRVVRPTIPTSPKCRFQALAIELHPIPSHESRVFNPLWSSSREPLLYFPSARDDQYSIGQIPLLPSMHCAYYAPSHQAMLSCTNKYTQSCSKDKYKSSIF